MRCEEIQERLVELLYNERGTPPASAELQGHVNSCPDCQKELRELEAVRSALKSWKDEPPLRTVAGLVAPAKVVPMRTRFSMLKIAKYGAVAAMVLLAFLAVSNAELTWNKDGFSFRTQLLTSPVLASSKYYDRAQIDQKVAGLREIVREVMDDSEIRMMEGNRVMLLRMMEYIEQDMDARFVRAQHARNQNRN
jgi:hypothetical protein